jgi:hypothetical protein
MGKIELTEIVAMIIGLVAVTVFLLSFQQKTRGKIIAFNATSRVLYIVQYILLGAFSGAVLDVLGIVASLLAGVRDNPKLKRYMKLLIPLMYIAFIVAGVFTYKSPLDLFALFAVMLHTGAFFLTDERKIRMLSLAGSPLWLVYNLTSLAIGSAIGDALSICSIGIAIYRYDYLPHKKAKLSQTDKPEKNEKEI